MNRANVRQGERHPEISGPLYRYDEFRVMSSTSTPIVASLPYHRGRGVKGPLAARA
jgi:hypothetical protein